MEKSSIAAHADEEEHKIFSKRMDKKRKLPSSWEQEERETGDVERRSEGRCGEKGSRAEVEDGGRSKKRRKSKTSAACAQDRAGISNTQPSCLRDDVSLTIRRLSFYHQIGRGSFGKVLLAADARGGPDLAVKIISKRDLLMEGREQALVESRVLELAAGSDFLIHAHFALQTKEHVLLGMEHASGGDFHQLHRRKGRLNIATARFYAAEIVCGVQFLHSQGIIHRYL
ncbi:protein kinase C delta type-like isoform X2 [Pseudophryne corroboree]|uniref:protein kinase C delta type-like isoform X2 n=1 Tax=Pseudophryne corroboree TaxID=495146 RepID=UPI003081A529